MKIKSGKIQTSRRQPAKATWTKALSITILTSLTALGIAEENPNCFSTDVKPYAISVSPEYTVKPVLSVGDKVPLTGDSSKQYQMIGIPDGLGVVEICEDAVALFMNHELTSTTISEPIVGAPLNRGSFISQFLIGKDGCVYSGERAYHSVFNEDTYVGPAPEVGNTTPAFSRFCSGGMNYTREGFDRPIYITGEETGAAGSYDGKGGSAVAVFDHELHTIPKFGHMAFENCVVRPSKGVKTVVMLLEDGAALESQLCMYVGYKDPSSPSVLGKNGLNNGRFYTFVPDATLHVNETTFQNTFITETLPGKWVEITNPESKNESELEAALDAAGAFAFIRIEDGAFSKTNSNEFLFVTTGGGPGNNLGRLYNLKLNPGNPTGPCTLSMVYNADQIEASGGDIALSPDNVDTGKDCIMICEDGTSQSRPKMTSHGRDGSIWRINSTGKVDRVVELNPPGTDTAPITAGIWETSGIVDTRHFFKREAWFFDVQAHGPTAAPAPNTVEDGQLLLLMRVWPFGE